MGSSLLGRDAEVARAEALVDRLPGAGGALLVKGAPGIGKSALLGEVQSHAAEHGIETLAAEGVESEAELAFAGLHQLLRPIRGGVETLPAPQRRALQAAFGMTGDDEPDPFLVALAAYELVIGATASAPLLLVADDAHWLDRSSLGVLAFIARRLAREPVVLLAACRDGYSTPLEDARLPTLSLGPLDLDAAGHLLDRSTPELRPGARARVLAEAAGNPLALIELGRTLQPSAPSGDAPMFSSITLTERLQRAFAARLDELGAETREALLVAALDQQASLRDVIAAVSRIHGRTVGPSVLDPAVFTGLIDIRGDELRFRHPLIRTAVSQSALPAELLATYGALAEVVADPERGLWHRARATLGLDDTLADALDAHAAVARRRGAMIAAAAALERAAELTSDPLRRGERLVRAAEVAYELGHVELVRRLLAQAESIAVGPLEAARLEWLRQMIAGDFWSQAGATRTFVTIAEQMAEAGDPDMALRSLVPIAHRCWWVRSKPRTRSYLVDAARRVAADDDDSRLLAVIALADPETTGLEVRRRLARLPSARLADPLGETYRGIAAEKAGDFVAGAHRLGRAVEQLREQGALGMLTQALVHYAWVATYTGDWQAAVESGREASALAQETRQPQFGLTARLMAALATATTGSETQIDAMLSVPEAKLLALGGGPLLAPAHLARGAAALGDGRHDEAFAHLWPVFDEASPVFHGFMRWPAVLDVVEAAVGCGRHDVAGAVLETLAAIAGVDGPPVLRAGVLCARPLVADDAAAEERFAAALEADLSGYPLLRARTLFAQGRWLRRHRRSADARTPLRAAADQFAALGASGWEQRARHELRATGDRTRSPADERTGLTVQERQIAELAAQGLSNREIAERLLLSPRTVGSHLYRIFPKLGVTTRAQLRDSLNASSR
ncbi:LuxR family transcriptional regulator [Solirubrobacter ginsenosidimutans]|uniref:LuxR family transcriptional regulator n=1 Tax=Solirubrobacter ginsenosidimutans TaxID=490573 RepID=A0A9X3MZQ1_9ACTN|nr:LuxR family transcriptional regulator [Solirubrobacter ginsenosidimutans]MDA0164373.1 LuxR family transcriptional regulator [Solirubrobacter ginsenosidimutans]